MASKESISTWPNLTTFQKVKKFLSGKKAHKTSQILKLLLEHTRIYSDRKCLIKNFEIHQETGPKIIRHIAKKDSIKCVVIGDLAYLKTNLLYAYALGLEYDRMEYKPTIFANLSKTFQVKGNFYHFELIDTAGEELYDRLRCLNYPSTDVFVVCFSVVDRTSFESVSSKWAPEIKHHCPKTPFILVGAQIEKREDPDVLENLSIDGQKPISYMEGKKLAKKLKAIEYLECSVETKIGIQDVFKEAFLASFLEVHYSGAKDSIKNKVRKCFRG